MELVGTPKPKKNLYGPKCSYCNGTDRFMAKWFPDDKLDLTAVIVRKGEKYYVVKASVERKVRALRTIRDNSAVWIYKCMLCEKHLPHIQSYPLDILAGYWEVPTDG